MATERDIIMQLQGTLPANAANAASQIAKTMREKGLAASYAAACDTNRPAIEGLLGKLYLHTNAAKPSADSLCQQLRR